MIPWWVAFIALLVGGDIGLAIMALLTANEPRPKNKYLKR